MPTSRVRRPLLACIRMAASARCHQARRPTASWPSSACGAPRRCRRSASQSSRTPRPSTCRCVARMHPFGRPARARAFEHSQCAWRAPTEPCRSTRAANACATPTRPLARANPSHRLAPRAVPVVLPARKPPRAAAACARARGDPLQAAAVTAGARWRVARRSRGAARTARRVARRTLSAARVHNAAARPLRREHVRAPATAASSTLGALEPSAAARGDRGRAAAWRVWWRHRPADVGIAKRLRGGAARALHARQCARRLCSCGRGERLGHAYLCERRALAFGAAPHRRCGRRHPRPGGRFAAGRDGRWAIVRARARCARPARTGRAVRALRRLRGARCRRGGAVAVGSSILCGERGAERRAAADGRAKRTRAPRRPRRNGGRPRRALCERSRNDVAQPRCVVRRGHAQRALDDGRGSRCARTRRRGRAGGRAPECGRWRPLPPSATVERDKRGRGCRAGARLLAATRSPFNGARVHARLAERAARARARGALAAVPTPLGTVVERVAARIHVRRAAGNAAATCRATARHRRRIHLVATLEESLTSRRPFCTPHTACLAKKGQDAARPAC